MLVGQLINSTNRAQSTVKRERHANRVQICVHICITLCTKYKPEHTHRYYTEWPDKYKSMYTVMQNNSTVINTNFVKLCLYQTG